MKRFFLLLVATIGAVALLVPATSFAAKKGTVVQKVPVKMNEFSFSQSRLKPAAFGEASALKPGKTRFVFNNQGEFPHNFTILYRSQGGSKFRSVTLDGGKKQRKTINLRAGSYIAVCTVFNGAHAAAGMFVNFTVGTQNPEDGSWG
jgi:hypothetical protein